MAVMCGDKDLDAKNDKTLDEKNKCLNCCEPVHRKGFFCDECWGEMIELGFFVNNGEWILESTEWDED